MSSRERHVSKQGQELSTQSRRAQRAFAFARDIWLEHAQDDISVDSRRSVQWNSAIAEVTLLAVVDEATQMPGTYQIDVYDKQEFGHCSYLVTSQTPYSAEVWVREDPDSDDYILENNPATLLQYLRTNFFEKPHDDTLEISRVPEPELSIEQEDVFQVIIAHIAVQQAAHDKSIDLARLKNSPWQQNGKEKTEQAYHESCEIIMKHSGVTIDERFLPYSSAYLHVLKALEDEAKAHSEAE